MDRLIPVYFVHKINYVNSMENLPKAIRIADHHRARLLAIVREIQKASGLDITPNQLMEALIKSKEDGFLW